MSATDWETSWTLKFSFPALSGMLALSFFIHNIIITIMQSNRDPSKNVSDFCPFRSLTILSRSTIYLKLQGRDLSIAYILVTITYIIVGVIFYICFPLSKSCIEDVS